ncbi:acetate--CoA ligase family protein [Cumulibacter soli]|uniref:acetate--CoA ligase family protein n=1 Tax=Cumulibacter soli TaxID=2546344 RepID=UPI001067DD4D|nr:acetate--CoA ligase family protein [Cumulibacter soli]
MTEMVRSRAGTDIAQALFEPSSIAIVGASSRLGSVSSRPLELLKQHGYQGDIYPVNPRYETLHDLRCYPDLTTIDQPVDLVLSLVPAAATLDVVRDAGRVGASLVIVFASGFAETGEAGAAMQQALLDEAHKSGVRVLGPNCQGSINPAGGVFATFTPAAQRTITGGSSVAYVGQSGAVGGSVLDMATELGLSLDAWAATGNQADIDLVEVAQSLVDGDRIATILLYAEGIADGTRFVNLCKSAQQRQKRLVLLRSGKSAVGKRAAASHTGAMLGDDAALIATAAQYGVLLVDDVDELLAVGTMLSKHRQLRGRRIGVITTSGGAGILLADHCEVHRLAVPELTAGTQQQLAELVPAFGATTNPVDVTAQILNTPTAFEDFAGVCRTVADDPHIDGVAVVLTMVTGDRAVKLAHALVDTVNAGFGKPLWVTWLASPSQTADGRTILRDAGIPVFDATGALALTVARVAPENESNSPDGEVSPNERAAAALEDRIAGRSAVSHLLAALGITTPASFEVTDGAEAERAVTTHGGRRYAFKTASKEIAHKSEIGGVLLDVEPVDARDAYDRITRAVAAHGYDDSTRVQIQQMVPQGVELLIGATVGGDGFPPLITVGSGGTATELYRDVSTRVAPVSDETALQMIQSLQIWPLLDGFRGMPRRDVAAAAAAVSAVSRMIAAFPDEALELEINPLVVAACGEGAIAVDLLIQTAGGAT